MTEPTGTWGLVPSGAVTSNPGPSTEIREKLARLRAAMKSSDLDAVYLEGWANVAWLSGGRGNRVVLDAPTGLCGMLIGHNRAWLLTPNNEEARCRAEAFAGLDLPVVSQPWFRLPLWQAVRPLLTPGAHLASDVPAGDAGPADTLMAPLRQRLNEYDTARFRALGADAAEALEAAVLEARPDWSELEVAGTIAAALKARAIEGAVVLVGCRARSERFRHLVPTGALVEGGFTASITATRHGLHASCTRAISFGPLPAELAERFAAAREVDRTFLAGSRPGETLGEAFEAGSRAYARHGYYDEWKEHHQGGTTGYAGREAFAGPGSDYRLEAGMAVAWNPTVPGAKSEDTYLVTGAGLEWLTRAGGSDWVLDEGDGELPRPAVLEV
ncbi:MAG: M24 family metallopeptidase [Candidatus Dormibacteria bacterium]